MSCSKMSKAVSSSAVDSQILPDGSPAVDSSMPSVEVYAAASPMLLPAVDEPTETVPVRSDWYAPHLDTQNPNEIAEDLIQRFSNGIPRCRLHEIAVGIINRHGQTLLPNGLSAAARMSAADSLARLYLSSAGDIGILPNEGINWSRTNRLPSETSSDSSGETDPELPALIDPPLMPTSSPPRVAFGTVLFTTFDRPIRADYVGHRLRIMAETEGFPLHRHGQVFPTQRTSDEHPVVAGYGLVSRNHLVAALEELD